MTYRVGDFVLVHGTAWYSYLIELGGVLRYRRRAPKIAKARFSHAAIIETPEGGLIEALGNGVVRSHISKYKNYKVFDISSVAPTDSDRNRVIEFAKACVGMQYDFLDIVSISLALLTGGRIMFLTEGRVICSVLVARCLERTTAIFPRNPEGMMPPDLAEYFSLQL